MAAPVETPRQREKHMRRAQQAVNDARALRIATPLPLEQQLNTSQEQMGWAMHQVVTYAGGTPIKATLDAEGLPAYAGGLMQRVSKEPRPVKTLLSTREVGMLLEITDHRVRDLIESGDIKALRYKRVAGWHHIEVSEFRTYLSALFMSEERYQSILSSLELLIHS